MEFNETATLLANSAYLKFIMSFHVIVSSIAMVALVHMLWNRKLFTIVEIKLKSENKFSTMKIIAHKSLILLMDFHTFWTFVMCISIFVSNVTTMHAHLTMRDPTDILVDAQTCMIRRTPLLMSCFGSIFSQLAMAAERYFASRKLSTYEKSGLAATFLISAMHFTVYGTEWTRAHCTVVTPEGGSVHTNLPIVTIISEVTTIVTFKRLLKRNRRLHDDVDSGLTLSERYQLAENIRMLQLLLPIIWSHTTLGLVGCALFIVGKLAFPSEDLYPLVEESTCTLYLQGILMPLILYYRFKQEERKAMKLRSVNTTRGPTLASYHAQAIMQRW